MKIVKKIIQSSLLCALVVFAASSTSTLETSIENTNISKTVNLSTMALKITENEYNKLYSPLSTYGGELTGYVYNCPLCTGRLACMSSLDLSNGTTTFVDDAYGEVNIVASSSNLPCGSIIKFDSDRISEDTTYAIVLDRGVLGADLDLLVEKYEDAITTVGRSQISYDVLRVGYGSVEE